jgi:hypothetical protein
MKKSVALSLALVLAPPVLVLQAGPAAAAGPDCPTGTTAVDYRAIDSHYVAKVCYKGSTDRVFWQDIYPDGISAYAKVYYYAPGSSQTSVFVSPYDGDGANNGWNSEQLDVDEDKALIIYACAYDQDGGTGTFNYGCGTTADSCPGERAAGGTPTHDMRVASVNLACSAISLPWSQVRVLVNAAGRRTPRFRWSRPRKCGAACRNRTDDLFITSESR